MRSCTVEVRSVIGLSTWTVHLYSVRFIEHRVKRIVSSSLTVSSNEVNGVQCRNVRTERNVCRKDLRINRLHDNFFAIRHRALWIIRFRGLIAHPNDHHDAVGEK